MYPSKEEAVEEMNIIIAGLGGQGVLFISSIIAEAISEDIQYCKIFDEGQRNGAVSCHIRIKEGPSPLIPLGKADLIASLDEEEFKRNERYLKKGGKCLDIKEDNMFLLGKIYESLGISKEKIIEILNKKPRAEQNIKNFLRGADA